MKILVDYSQTVISSVFANAKELKSGEPKNLIKHIILSQLLGIKKRFGGELIICCDARDYWRKKEFPHYKAHRKHAKDNDILDWDLLYETMDETKAELKENFPYKVLEINQCEADDIFGVLVKYFDENELAQTGLVEDPQNIVLVSSDGDFIQLQKYRNVKQWHNGKKEFITVKNPYSYLNEHICKGDAGDNIPNAITGDDWAKARADGESVRAKPMSAARLQDFVSKGYDACLNETEQRNWRRNQKLVDFDYIPSNISNAIIGAYIEYETRGSKKKVFDYLVEHRMKLLTASAQEF